MRSRDMTNAGVIVGDIAGAPAGVVRSGMCRRGGTVGDWTVAAMMAWWAGDGGVGRYGGGEDACGVVVSR